MTTNQAIKLQQLFLQVSEIFGEIAGQEVAEVKAPTNVVDLPVQTETVEVEQQEVVETEPETPSLESLSIAELRKMAKELGLDTKGKKVDIIARIEALNEPVEENVEEVVEEVIETPEVEVDDVEDEVLIEDEDDAEEEYEEEEEEEEADEDDEEPSDLELLKAELEDYSLEELKEVLESVELSTKGKKQALISRIIQAVEDGIIAYGDDEEEIEVEDDLDELVTDEDEIEVEEVTDEEESDDEEDYEDEEEEEELTVREQAQAEIEERILEDYENGDLTDKQITKFLNEYSNGTFKTVNKKRSLNKYIEIMTELVDEDGDVVELGEPYYVGDDVAFCCGAELKEVDGDFYCEICGNEYEGE